MSDNKDDQLVPRFDLRKLTAGSAQGGANAENAYHEWHKQHGINVGHNKLKRKYTGG